MALQTPTEPDRLKSPTELIELSGVRPPMQERMHQYFEASVDRVPHHVALELEDRRLTYAELDALGNALAHHLRDRGVEPGQRIGLLLNRSLEMYVGLLGIMKAGCAFVPIDPASPSDRVSFISEDSSLSMLLSTSGIPAHHASAAPVLLLDDPSTQDAVAAAPTTRPAPDGLDDPTAYIIYTSGSSGRPKGVDVAQSSIVNFIHVITEVYDVRETDRIYQGMTIAFDFAIEEVWPTWAAGATLVAGPTDARRVGAGLTEFLETRGITILYCVPTVLSTVERTIDSIRSVMVGGEACPAELVERWAPGRRMLNTYGPTEATVTCTWGVLRPGRAVTIGVPVPTYTATILDDDRQPVPFGEVGELCIGGPGVARGYINRPELNVDRFIQDPEGSGERIYRTGDLARFQEDGEIVYLGRADAEVKIRGHRVDLGEIESVMMRDPRVPTAAVNYWPDGGGGDLAGYITVNEDETDVDGLRQKLWEDMRDTLPSYMVPSFLETIDEMPMLPSGKVDRKALPRPSTPRLVGGGEHVPPATPTEEWMAGVWADAFGVEPDQLSVQANFFDDLGGHSLVAASLVSRLREDPRGAQLSVMDLYATPTVRGMAGTLDESGATEDVGEALTTEPIEHASTGRIWLFGLAQAVAVLLMLMVAMSPVALAYWWYSGVPSISLLQLMAVSLPISYLGTRWVGPLVVARLLGDVKPGSYPLYSMEHLRVWMAGRAMELSPMNHLAGSALAAPYLRLAGARVDDSAHVGTPITTLPARVTIDAGVAIGYATRLDAWSVSGGRIEVGDIHLREDSTVLANSVVVAPCEIGIGAMVQEQSVVGPDLTMPPGEVRAGSPATVVPAPGDDIVVTMAACDRAPRRWGLTQVVGFVWGVLGLELLPMLALLLPVVLVWATLLAGGVWWGLLASLLTGPLFVVSACALILGLRNFGLPRMPVGIHHLRSQLGVDKWFADRLLEASLLLTNSMYSTLYTPPWLRLLGARVGKRAEVSTIANIDPSLLTLHDESFVADMASVGSATYCRGHVAFRPTEVGERAFVGNAAFVPSGSKMGQDSLLGVGSTPPAAGIQPGESWLGSPSFFLPQREMFEGYSEEDTYRPSRKVVIGRYLIEFVRATLPGTLLGLSTFATLQVASALAFAELPVWAMIMLLPAVAMLAGLATTLFVALMKWVLMGRYRKRVEPLWSQFVRVSELVTGVFEAAAVPVLLMHLQGTPMLGPVLRLFGVRVGRHALVESTYITEFDLVSIGRRAYIGPAVSLQTHLFEDRVMKMDEVRVADEAEVGARSVVLYGSDVQERSRLRALSLVMKGETTPARTVWQGIPAQPVRAAVEDATTVEKTLEVAR
ncbi:Pls/PosA family non-ribosomal peptide synthetase [Kytococcus sedentarius]|uniref:Amino acid adenylation enzyme/thioester reductase family protein n=1 Tax=Kytococcus sedentarius (strain ATCC 14392 / DSM 20547 / JCM 11482 / CCUG 33030 / NBRC 15357 / NCTC 11040 / CCM 314 / 541) TaxID=478801 RepID=C7NKG7_KYTSD|nr:Pls/PosA family non-ribosomal peptide synthetase [Kytococcus sedentarius]ACV07005.1 amino acid adenylation enzyme/thioester reductase family protein [Kytococcus sedentarius DSM 20547]